MVLFRNNAIIVFTRGATSAPALRYVGSSRSPSLGFAPSSPTYPTSLYRIFSSSRITHKKQEQSQRQDEHSSIDLKNEEAHANRKVSRKTAAKTSSLRRVAVEAQNARGFVKGKGSKRFVDPEVDTKTVTAYCAAEQYNISAASRSIKAQGYQLDPYQTGLYPQVIHVQTSEKPSESKDHQGRGDIFIFPSGTVVAWDVRSSEALNLINRILPASAEGSHLELLETEDLEYVEDPSIESSEIIGDTIVLGTKAESLDTNAREEATNHPQGQTATVETVPRAGLTNETDQRHEVDTILAKIAFSSGLARSTKLAVLESLLSNYQHATRSIPTMLAQGSNFSLGKSKLPFTRSFILRKTGELLSIRAQLNLYSELTDSLPDIFWDSRHELGLGEYYDQVGRALDVGVRIKVLNEKIGFAQEIASVLRESLSEKHGLRLEWAIIALIAVEVVLEFYRHWKDVQERDNPGSTESLLRRYLEKVNGK